MSFVDLRSDTVTRPAAAMRQAMASAEVGDDVYGEDPTVVALETRVAALLGKEAALFVPSGTMANQIAVRVHTRPGDEVILEAGGHSFLYETGALAGINGVQAHPVAGTRGLLAPEAVAAAVRPAPDHYARSRLLIVENTANAGGGTIYSVEHMREVAEVARAAGLRVHLDGARLFNAHVATGAPLEALAGPADSVSVCLSKGLGAPVGSVLAGDRAFIVEAHRARKMFGGGMRQAGILAAAGLYALEHHVERLAEDHRRLEVLVRALSALPGLDVRPEDHPTNIGYVKTAAPAATLVERLFHQGVRVNATGPREIRVVTHLDLDDDAIARAIDGFERAL